MSHQEDTIDWQAIDLIDRWLDSEVHPDYQDQPLAQDLARVAKVSEESGEAISAFIGMTGQNPRKGVINSSDDLFTELAQTALTAILGIQHFAKNTTVTRAIIRQALKTLESRVPNEYEVK